MARIRSIKPDFWTSADVLECSLNARLLFIGMWNFADDCGRISASPKSLKAQIFPSDDLSLDTILGMVVELSTNDLILPYSVDGKDYLQIKNWHHQRIDKPQDPKHPPAREGYSKTIRGTIPPDRIGEDKIGEEGKGETRATRARAFPDPWTEADWHRFYSAYPNKVGKPKAQKAFAKAVHRTTPDELFAGLDRYLNKTDDRAWCNPATWLNEDRWNDKPAVATGPPRAFRAATQGFESLLQNGFANDHPATDPGFDLDLTANPANRPALGQRG